MSHYSHLLSPLRIGNVVLKNRMIASNALPHFLQGPESFPAEPVIDHLAYLARNGAAVVTVADWSNPKQRVALIEDWRRFPMWDPSDPSVQNYLSQVADAVHFYGSKLSLAIMHFGPRGYEVCDTPALEPDFGLDTADPAGSVNIMSQLLKGDSGPSEAMTDEKMEEMAEEIAQQAKFYQALGFDMITLHMAYRGPMLAKFLSPLTNKRTDRYGGSLENRARFPLALCRRIKDVCGEDFLVEAQISGEEDGGTTIEDTVAFAKMAEGAIDILQLRAGTGELAHPIGYNSVEGEPLTLRYAEAIKRSGANVLVEPIGGFQDPGKNDEYIASGRADLIGMARAFICDPDYLEKIYQGRGDDVVPCIRCNRCHVVSMTGPWSSVCSVNPVIGTAHRVGRMVSPPREKLKVAVVGGGPAGMEAAIVAAGRGHEVTLYEQNSLLGGQLRVADVSSSKWPLKKFKDHLVCSLDKAGVVVLLDTRATPGLIREGGYDAVLVAVGARPIIPNIPGADAGFVWTPLSVYGDHASLGKRVVVVGGSESGTETGMYLAEHGHEVTVLTRQDRLASDATPIHYVEIVRGVWEQMENFAYITRAATTSISKGKVTYADAEGNEKTLEADDIVVSGGMSPLYDEALGFHGAADRFFLIGDCSEVGNVQTSIRSAFSAASQL